MHKFIPMGKGWARSQVRSSAGWLAKYVARVLRMINFVGIFIVDSIKCALVYALNSQHLRTYDACVLCMLA